MAANKTGAPAMIGASESAIPLVEGEAIQARAEISWGASCRRTPLSTRVVFDVIYRIVSYIDKNLAIIGDK